MDLDMDLTRLKKDPKSIAMSLVVQTLNGVVLAQVGGGIPKIEEAFLEPEYTKSHQQDADYIRLLKEEIVKQMKIIDDLLPIHGKGSSLWREGPVKTVICTRNYSFYWAAP